MRRPIAALYSPMRQLDRDLTLQQLCPFTISMNKNLKNVVYALFAGCFGGLLLPLVMKIPSEASAANVLKWVASVLAIPGAFLTALVNGFKPKRSGHVLTRESGYCNRRLSEVVFLV
jgi:hypothetical protein